MTDTQAPGATSPGGFIAAIAADRAAGADRAAADRATAAADRAAATAAADRRATDRAADRAAARRAGADRAAADRAPATAADRATAAAADRATAELLLRRAPADRRAAGARARIARVAYFFPQTLAPYKLSLYSGDVRKQEGPAAKDR